MGEQNQGMTEPIRPEDVLPDGAEAVSLAGVVARKGTVAAFVANAKLPEGSPEHEAVLSQLRVLAPGLRAVGVLEVFIPR